MWAFAGVLVVDVRVAMQCCRVNISMQHSTQREASSTFVSILVTGIWVLSSAVSVIITH